MRPPTSIPGQRLHEISDTAPSWSHICTELKPITTCWLSLNILSLHRKVLLPPSNLPASLRSFPALLFYSSISIFNSFLSFHISLYFEKLLHSASMHKSIYTKGRRWTAQQEPWVTFLPQPSPAGPPHLWLLSSLLGGHPERFPWKHQNRLQLQEFFPGTSLHWSKRN